LVRYETIFVLDNNAEKDSLVDKFVEKFKSLGAEIVNVDRWGKKRFAYEIDKRQYGDYTAVEFMAAGDVVKSIEREYRLNESVLRFLTYKISKHQLRQRELDSKKAATATKE
jgi:small subunit ribosomal protein S6